MPTCECSFCRNELEFAFPKELLERIASGQAVIFAGAGISTENPAHCRTTLYDEIRHELGADKEIDFPGLMSVFCAQPDGRIKLIVRIKNRIEYFRSFRGFRVQMTKFHRALRPLFMFTDVITTNWDDFFESEAGYDPFVYDQDLALTDSSKRRVIKIHGSITNYGSIVATTEDYTKSFRRLHTGSMGAYVKNFLASKTIIYVGYSLRDSNYLKLVKNINAAMGSFARTSYFVSPFVDLEYLSRTKLPLIPLQTDGTFFLEQFREHYNNSCDHSDRIIDEANFDRCIDLLQDVNEYHEYTASEYLRTRRPLLILALSYQDGLQDALMRIKDRDHTGEYYNARHVYNLVAGYEVREKSYSDSGDLWNACYCRGYGNGLLYLLADRDVGPPPIVDLIFDGSADTTPKVLRYAIKNIPDSVKMELSELTKQVGDGELIPEHMPYV